MTRTKLIERKLPSYTRGEEIFNMTSHIIGGAFGIAAFILCVCYAAVYANKWGLISGSIYGVSMILLYTMSSIYHGLTNELAKKVFQVIDHCSVFILIAGTYTPILLTGMRSKDPVSAWGLFGFVWGMSIIGIVLNAIDLRKFRVFSMICYLGVGWCIIFAAKQMLDCYPVPMFVWILAGGVSYTIGSVLYGLGRKKRYAHSVFHLFVLIGSILQFVGIFEYCIIPQ